MTAPVQVGPSPSGGGPVPSPDWEDVLADIGDRIRAERKARRWSLSELSRRSGLARSTLAGLEGGHTTLRVFAQACAALQVDMGHVLSAGWRMPEERPHLTPAQIRALRAVADGAPLSVAAGRLVITTEGLASRLSEVYRRLGVADVARGVPRRMAAVGVARKYGLLGEE